VPETIVVGGGIAGLAAGWALRDRDVLVLEASERAGGRVRSERRGELWLNFGAHVFAGPGSATDRLLQETGVRAAEVPGVLTAVALRGRLVAGGRVETYPLRLPLSAAERVALARTGLRLRAAVRRYARVPGDQVLAHLGDRSFAEWLGPVPAAVDEVVRATLRRSSAEPEQLAAGYGIGYFHLVWDRAGGLARNILGGPASLPEAIADELGERLRIGAVVEHVSAGRDGVLVRCGGEELHARQVVLATPAHVTRAIWDAAPAELERVTYGRYVLVAMLAQEAGARRDVYAVATPGCAFNMLFNMANVLGRGGSLMAYSGGRLADALWELPDEQVVDRYLADLLAVLPGVDVTEAVVHRWEHGLPYVAPGRHRIQAALERVHERVALAGDYLGSRYTDTAIASGLAAAQRFR
jgi:oxygen-dependent protoporphyrinogen oxidase